MPRWKWFGWLFRPATSQYGSVSQKAGGAHQPIPAGTYSVRLYKFYTNALVLLLPLNEMLTSRVRARSFSVNFHSYLRRKERVGVGADELNLPLSAPLIIAPLSPPACLRAPLVAYLRVNLCYELDLRRRRRDNFACTQPNWPANAFDKTTWNGGRGIFRPLACVPRGAIYSIMQ